MKSKQRRSVICIGAIFSMAMTMAATAHAQYAGSSAITTWSGQCSGGERLWWDDMCMAWRKQMGSKSWVEWKRNYSQVQGSRYADNSVKVWGNDDASSGMDWNDAGMICTHGGWSSGRWTGSLYDKDPDNSCKMSSNKMSLGWNSGGWLRFMHLSSCNSIRYDQRTQWFDAANGVHVVTGFHGLMYIGSQSTIRASRMRGSTTCITLTIGTTPTARCAPSPWVLVPPCRPRATRMTKAITHIGRIRRRTGCTRAGIRAAIRMTDHHCRIKQS
jgi:hypothetical protein